VSVEDGIHAPGLGVTGCGARIGVWTRTFSEQLGHRPASDRVRSLSLTVNSLRGNGYSHVKNYI
jgi:hypothetical protein